MLEPVQRAFSCHRGTIGAPRRELAGKQPKHRIMPKLVVVDQILIAERNPEDTLPDQGRYAVLDQLRMAPVLEAPGEPLNQAERPIGCAEQQAAGIGSHHSPIKSRDHLMLLDRFKAEQVRATLCLHRGTSLESPKWLLHNNFSRFGAPMHPP
jgi:hypothetical protein